MLESNHQNGISCSDSKKYCNEKSDKDCECGENFYNVKCSDCDKVYCTKYSSNNKFGKNRDEEDYSLCRINSYECELCNKIYCSTPWIKCESCSYNVRLQCDNCKKNCSLCNKSIHKYCIEQCNQCGIDICLSCADSIIPVFEMLIIICKNCKKTEKK